MKRNNTQHADELNDELNALHIYIVFASPSSKATMVKTMEKKKLNKPHIIRNRCECLRHG